MPFSPRGIEQSLVLPPRWPLILYTGTLYKLYALSQLSYQIVEWKHVSVLRGWWWTHSICIIIFLFVHMFYQYIITQGLNHSNMYSWSWYIAQYGNNWWSISAVWPFPMITIISDKRIQIKRQVFRVSCFISIYKHCLWLKSRVLQQTRECNFFFL